MQAFWLQAVIPATVLDLAQLALLLHSRPGPGASKCFWTYCVIEETELHGVILKTTAQLSTS